MEMLYRSQFGWCLHGPIYWSKFIKLYSCLSPKTTSVLKNEQKLALERRRRRRRAAFQAGGNSFRTPLRWERERSLISGQARGGGSRWGRVGLGLVGQVRRNKKGDIVRSTWRMDWRGQEGVW